MLDAMTGFTMANIDFVSIRGNSVLRDNVFWLEQMQTSEPVASFERA